MTANERASEVANLCQVLGQQASAQDAKVLEEICHTARELQTILLASNTAQDLFRRADGFQAALTAIKTAYRFARTESEVRSDTVVSATSALLSLLSAALFDHYGNERYFQRRLNGWVSLTTCLDSLLDAFIKQDARDAIITYATALCRFSLGKDDGDRVAGSLDITDHSAPSVAPETAHAAAELTRRETVVFPKIWALLIRSAIRWSRLGSGELLEFSRRILSLAYQITSLSTRNQVVLWETGIMTVLLCGLHEHSEKAPYSTELENLVRILSPYGLQSLDDAADLFQKACRSDRSRALLLQNLQASKGPAFVQFDLSQCGYSSIELQSLPRAFPPSTGYSLTAWMRFDQFDPSTHTTLFGAFDSSQTCFILAYLERDSRSLILQTSIRSSRPSVRFKSTRFNTGHWYHVAIVHRRSASDPKVSTAMLFVNGEFAEQVKIGYPESPAESRNLDEIAASGRRQAKPVMAFFGTPHDLAPKLGKNEVHSKWSLASGHLYQAPLTDELLAVYYKLGPRYNGNMQDCLGPLLTYRASAELNRYNELLHPDRSEKSDIVTATEARGSDVVPEARVLFGVSPLAVLQLDGSDTSTRLQEELTAKARTRLQALEGNVKAIAINPGVPTLSEAVGRSYGAAALTGDPVVVLPGSLDDASWEVAGCLPLLLRLLETATTKAAFLQAVHIAFECVKDSWRISEAMEKGHWFGVMAVIIREKLGFETGASSANATSRKPSPPLPLEDRQTVPLELLQLILEFLGHDKTSPENSMIVNPMGYRVLIIDFDTWRRCDTSTQQLYYAQFAHFVTRNKHQAFNHKRLTRMRVIKKLVEALKSESIASENVAPFMTALKALLDGSTVAHHSYKDLAMLVVHGLQDERSQQLRPLHSMASIMKVRQRAVSWARRSGSTPTTPGGASPSRAQPGVNRAELAISMLQLLVELLCDEKNVTAVRRFVKAVPLRWLLHLFAEADVRVVVFATRIMHRALLVMGSEFKTPFVDKNGGFSILRARLKTFWRTPSMWVLSFAILFGCNLSATALEQELTLFGLIELLGVGEKMRIDTPEMLSPIMAMLETALRDVVKSDEAPEADVKLITTIIQLLKELQQRSATFRDFAAGSRYVQELLFVLYPVVVGSDRLSADVELAAKDNTLSFRGEEVKMRPHSNSLGQRPPSVRSLNIDDGKRTPSPSPSAHQKRVAAPKRLSSFILINGGGESPRTPSSKFEPPLTPNRKDVIKLNVGNDVVESLLDVATSLFIDLICTKKDFAGIGLFMKVPPGFREHQAYFESYVLVHTLSALWNTLQLNQVLLQDTRVLTNLGRYSLHMAEAVFEGWFIDGAQPLIDFIGKVLDYLQTPDVANLKNVRLCAQATNTMRVVFLRVMLLRLSELDELEDEKSAITFLDQMNYWQTILFSTENQETPFIRLICYLLYMKLTSTVTAVRHAAARIWRTMLVQKPTETATLLTYAMGSEQRHLSTGFMKLVSLDEEEFIKWVDSNRSSLDKIFVDALAKPWDEFVNDENRRNEESAKGRLSKRREKLRQWQSEELGTDDFLQRYETSTTHWRANVHAQERLKLQRATQDHQESVHHLLTVFARLEQVLKQPCGPDATATVKWQLDETEGVNRMRMRLLPDTSVTREVYQPKRMFSQRLSNGPLAINTQIARNVRDDILSSMPPTPGSAIIEGTSEATPANDRSLDDSITSSQLLDGGFEVIEDPKEDEDGIVEDKNRKIMTSLARGDMVQQLYNVSRIVGLEACEGLLVIGKKRLYLQDSYFQRSDGEIVSVSQAPEDERDPYLQLISGKDVGAQRTKNSVGDQTSRQWVWTEVLSVSKRRFLFRDVSLEVFFSDGRSYLLTCMTPKMRDDLYSAITSRAPHIHAATTSAGEDSWRLDNLRNPEETPQTLGSRFTSVFANAAAPAATKQWMKGELSNFQYLMLINTMAGRSFNDLTQYPVFPWVLADYSSEVLDLSNPNSFREFSKPMGCQTPSREAEFRDRYKQFAEMGDENAPAFNYGTHYSSAMIVTSYLIRMQPFVQSYLLLQGGNFDHADRLFDSIEKAWLSASQENMSDVRELTPEFYYLPEFLTNLNGYDFGVKQGGGEVVSDVKFPAWAKGDPQVFIAKHREALESPHVSQNLHKWIDLIFGYKQRGEAAVEATNVFQHLSYGGAKDLDTIDDPVERLATIGIIHSFGQTPHQVFQRPHPGREIEKHAVARLDTMAESLSRLPSPLFESDEKVCRLVYPATQERLLCTGPCKLNMLPNCDRFMQWGFADHSIRFFSSNTKRLLGLYENTHIGSITTAVFADSKTLITAGEDCTIAVWTVTASRDAIDINPKTYLFGHRAPVTILVASRVFSTLLSVANDGQCLLWDLNRNDCIRVLTPAGDAPVQAASISSISGHIALCRGPNLLLYTINGHLLLSQQVCDSQSDSMLSCAFYSGANNEWVERELIFTGHAHGVVNVWSLAVLSDGAWHLQLVNRLNHVDGLRDGGVNRSAGISALLPMPGAVYTGDEDGRVWEWSVVQRQGSVSARGR
ncbi:hypothetical protein B0A48_17937 [Cryoendolithus antarcticus]|uniref:Beach-domain-containing protein n=1 Tax=Cryoendolithus antarcticus TaxID=1507870 RepID=A0A1V8S9R8_9PEZI|nr:hypothetical protein B0A48_17937 [Cryoendolithus antarcticus]